MTPDVQRIEQLKKLIAGNIEARAATVQNFVDDEVLDLTQATREKLQKHNKRLMDSQVLELFDKAKKHLPVTGVKSLFFSQTEVDRAELRALKKDVKARIFVLASDNMTFPEDEVINKYRNELRAITLKLQVQSPIQKVSRHQLPVQRKNTVSAPLPRSASSFSQANDDPTNSVITNYLMMDALIGHHHDSRNIDFSPSVVSGNGGDFGGGGATAGWNGETMVESTPVNATPAVDDLGASNFS